MRTLLAVVALSAPVAVAGCGAGLQADFDSVDPQERTAALAKAARQPALADAPRLISLLDSVDPAERMLAIRTLERLTGQTMGYRHFDPESTREQAVERWRDWWIAQTPTATTEEAPPAAAQPEQTAQSAPQPRRSPRPPEADPREDDPFQ